MSWASHRRTGYLLSLFAVIFIVAVGIGYALFRPIPSCQDGRKNGTETGVDCGGSCRAVCKEDAIPLAIRFARALPVKDGTYSAVAYVENPNQSIGVDSISYTFRLLDKEGVLVTEKTGTTFISPGGLTPVFLPNIDAGERVPVHTVFSFAAAPFWIQAPSLNGALLVRNKQLSNETTAPRLTAELQNTTIRTFDNIEVVAVLFDKEENAIATSGTVIPHIEKNGTADVIFTWPRPFTGTAVQIDIIPRIPPLQ